MPGYAPLSQCCRSYLTYAPAPGVRQQGLRTVLRFTRGDTTRPPNSHYGASHPPHPTPTHPPDACHQDNHDAEAFLKPVARSDVPDYYDGACVICLLISLSYIPLGFVVISNPMDLQSMLKKVKAKQYKSKREFKDDLDLIWSNCFTYNATEASSPMVVLLFY